MMKIPSLNQFPSRGMIALGLLAIILLQGAPSFSADFRKGMAAARNGDFSAAMTEWLPLAQQGHATAQYFVGMLHQNGQGTAQDNATAAKWYQRAAQQGLADAQYSLAVMHDNGFGVPQSYAKAMTWYKRAAAQGDADAHYNIGKFYAKGLGVAKDPVRAYAWWHSAAKAGHKGARIRRDALAKSMTPADIEAARTITNPD